MSAVEQVSVEESIAQAIQEVENQTTNETEQENEQGQQEEQDQVDGSGESGSEETEERARDESGRFTKKEPQDVTQTKKPEKQRQEEVKPQAVAKTATTEKQDAAPQSWGAAVKSKWAELPPEVRAEIAKREGDIHQMMTRHDGELRLGRDMKDVIAPYMPIITAEGGNPVTAVQSLLNTAYLLRTGSAQQKLELFKQLAQQYTVDLNQVSAPQQQIDPVMQNILNELNGLKQNFSQQQNLQQQAEHNRIVGEIQAFAANPANVHFEQVKAHMASLLGSNQAKDLQEAYDKACWAEPSIRSTLLANQEQEAAEKRKAELAKKKQAAVSVTGSPGVKTPSSTKSNKSVEEELRDVMDDVMGSKF